MFSQPLERGFNDVHIAWDRDLGGLPVDPQVTAAIDTQRGVFESLGCVVVDDAPNFTDADEAFKVWRAWRFELAYSKLLETHPDQIKETVVWNIKAGMELSGPQIGEAEIKRTALYQRVREFMETYEFLILPVNQALPFDVKQRYITEIDGVKMETYIDWMRSCYYISVLGLPAISVPCGFTPDGFTGGRPKSSGDTKMTLVYSNWLMPLNRLQVFGNRDRLWLNSITQVVCHPIGGV